MTQVVEDSKKEHHVERPDAFRCQVHYVDVEVFDAGPQRLPCQLESRLGPPAGTRPRIVIRRHHPRRATFLRLEREESIPGPDVQDRATGERRQVQACEAVWAVVHAFSHDALAKVDRVIPPERGGSRPKILVDHHSGRASGWWWVPGRRTEVRRVCNRSRAAREAPGGFQTRGVGLCAGREFCPCPEWSTSGARWLSSCART